MAYCFDIITISFYKHVHVHFRRKERNSIDVGAFHLADALIYRVLFGVNLEMEDDFKRER